MKELWIGLKYNGKDYSKKIENCINNLEWCTVSENNIHAYKMGLSIPKRGVENVNSKLTEKDIKFIRENYIPRDKVFGIRALARKFNMNHSNISRIISNKKYK